MHVPRELRKVWAYLRLLIEYQPTTPVSPHFSLYEFHQPRRLKLGFKTRLLPPRLHLWSVITLAWEVLEVIRERADRPLRLNSGYRSAEYNRAIRGAEKSQHLLSKACDCWTPGLKGQELHSIVLELYLRGKLPKLGGLGLYPKRNFIHIDIREKEKGRLARWRG